MSEPTRTRLTVKYYHEIPGVVHGNIMWPGNFPMRNGSFPASHPASPGDRRYSASQLGGGDRMVAFRERGYWASCFPEGDGITMQTERGQNAAQVARDIEEVFGWRVKIERGDPTASAVPEGPGVGGDA